MSSSLKDQVERRIAQALAEGAFENLPGQGKPLNLNEDPLVPEEVRVGNRIMKNAGILPPEVEQLNQLANLQRAGSEESTQDAAEQARTRRRLLALTLKLRSRGLSLATGAGGAYRQAVINRLTGSR